VAVSTLGRGKAALDYLARGQLPLELLQAALQVPLDESYREVAAPL
jgi:hypothetical protein